jgi:hypothetical protein
MKIVLCVREYNDYFMCKPDCTGIYGSSSIQKCTAALWCIAYGAPCDTNEDYLCMPESTCFETVVKFCRAVTEVFGKDYLRARNEQTLLESWHEMQQEDFTGSLGASIACIGIGRTAHLPDKDYTKDIPESAV